MKLNRFILLVAGVMLLAGCEKMPSSSLVGRWKPVYASGSYQTGGYIDYYDGPADEHGVVYGLRVLQSNPDIKKETHIMILGIRFFRKDGKDVFATFEMDTPNEEYWDPLMYKIEDGILYREMPWGYLINDSLDHLKEGSGQFDKGMPISSLDKDLIKIGNYTYQRMDQVRINPNNERHPLESEWMPFIIM